MYCLKVAGEEQVTPHPQILEKGAPLYLTSPALGPSMGEADDHPISRPALTSRSPPQLRPPLVLSAGLLVSLLTRIMLLNDTAMSSRTSSSYTFPLNMAYVPRLIA